jgi:hypothetical protein
VREHPIRFSGPMVRAILDGRKTQTRRYIKRQGEMEFDKNDPYYGPYWEPYAVGDTGVKVPCPYGEKGDSLVLLSEWATERQYDSLPPSKLPTNAMYWTLYDSPIKPAWCGRTRSPRYAPKAALYIFPRTEITDVRVERLQDISENDAKAEGVLKSQRAVSSSTAIPCYWDYLRNEPNYRCARDSFASLWESMYAKRGRGRGWDTNPMVWVIELKRIIEGR